MLSDDRLQHVLDEQRFAGIGLYYFMLQLVECQGEGAIAFNQVIGALERRYSRKKILRFIQDYDLFVLTEEGLVLSVDSYPWLHAGRDRGAASFGRDRCGFSCARVCTLARVPGRTRARYTRGRKREDKKREE